MRIGTAIWGSLLGAALFVFSSGANCPASSAAQPEAQPVKPARLAATPSVCTIPLVWDRDVDRARYGQDGHWKPVRDWNQSDFDQGSGDDLGPDYDFDQGPDYDLGPDYDFDQGPDYDLGPDYDFDHGPDYGLGPDYDFDHGPEPGLTPGFDQGRGSDQDPGVDRRRQFDFSRGW